MFELANGGTLFLDEIGELPLEARGLLLRVLEEGRFMRVGGAEEVEIDVRRVREVRRERQQGGRRAQDHAEHAPQVSVIFHGEPLLTSESGVWYN